MDFNVSEVVTQKTKELVEKVIVEYWYNTTNSVAKQIREKFSGRAMDISDLRAELSKLCEAVKHKDSSDWFSQIMDKKTEFMDLVEIFRIIKLHLHKEGILKYESEKGYHSVIGEEMDIEQTLQN